MTDAVSYAPTIGELRKRGVKLKGTCMACGRDKPVDLCKPPFDRLAAALSLTEACYRLRCQDCKGRRVFIEEDRSEGETQ